MRTANAPTVLIIAGNDPSGGAGIAADITSCAQQGCHPAPVISCLTVQDTGNVYAVEPVSTALLRQQVKTVITDMPIAAIKLGVLANAAQINAITPLLIAAQAPIVLDPVLVATGGGALTTDSTSSALLDLLPHTTIITPNQRECEALGGLTKLRSAATNILLTGGDNPTPNHVQNTWYTSDQEHNYQWPRLTGEFHGSGCSLASTLAARLAHGDSLATAIESSQHYVHQMLIHAYSAGQGAHIPHRLTLTDNHAA